MVELNSGTGTADGGDPAHRFTLVRALGNLEPDEKVRCADHLARHFLDGEWKLALKFRATVLKRLEANAPGAYCYGLARTGFFDARLQECIDAGVRQILILGSGFDSRAFRLGGTAPLDFFEFDRAEVHRVKAARAAEAGLAEPPNHVSRVPVDFGRLDAGTFFKAIAMDFGKPFAVLAEGLLYYLPEGFFGSLLNMIGRDAVSGSALIFDYAHSDVLEASEGLYGADSVARFARGGAEPFLFTTGPERVGDACAGAGLTVTHDFDHERMVESHLMKTDGSVLGQPFGGFHLCCIRKP